MLYNYTVSQSTWDGTKWEVASIAPACLVPTRAYYVGRCVAGDVIVRLALQLHFGVQQGQYLYLAR